MLIESNIPFDIALVNYNIRKNSHIEQNHAIALAKRYNLKIYTTNAPKYSSHFESNAREFRYHFFEELIDRYSYENLLTAHQLNDQLEWLLMRLTKGAGLAELLGLKSLSLRKSSSGNEYRLIRPLLDMSKDQLLQYLTDHKYPYFIDESNIDHKYERNRFRADFSDRLMSKYRDGIKRSFEYLQRDKLSLLDGIELIFSKYELRVYQLKNYHLKVKATDLALKELGYLLSSAQRREIERQNSLVIGGKWAIVYQDDKLYISPSINIVMDKSYKELCRISSLPIKVRAYCYKMDIKPIEVMKLD